VECSSLTRFQTEPRYQQSFIVVVVFSNVCLAFFCFFLFFYCCVFNFLLKSSQQPISLILMNNFLLKSSQQPISLILICNIDTTVENKYSTLKKQKKAKKSQTNIRKNYNNNKTLLVPWFCLETGKARKISDIGCCELFNKKLFIKISDIGCCELFNKKLFVN
jgi:hypothetical protein